MEKFISMLLMVTPGFFVRKAIEEIKTMKEIKSETEKTITSLIYSMPVLIINLSILLFIFKYSSIDEIVTKFKSLKFILCYFFITIISVIIVTIVFMFFEKEIKVNLINYIRSKMNQPEKTTSNSPWEDFFKESGIYMPIKIFKDGDMLSQGFVRHWDLDGKNLRDIVLEYTYIMEENPEWFKDVKKEYIDYRENLIIREYCFDESNIL